MGSINANVGGVDFTITKQPDGSYTYSTESLPGSSFGANNEAVAGHAGGVFSAASIASFIQSTQDNLIATKQSFIEQALKDINDPSTSAAWKSMQKASIAKAQADIDAFKDQVAVLSALQGQADSLISQADAADTAGVNPEAKTGEQATADAASAQYESEKTQLQGTTTDNPTNDNAGQTDFSKNGSDNPSDDTSGASGYSGVGLNPNAGGTGLKLDAAGIGLKAAGSAGGLGAKLFGKTAPATATWKEANDLRAILRVPPSYITGFTDPAGALAQFGGIVFPYTPSISFDHTATYNAINPLHSNYTQFTYKNSAVGAIQVNAKFTVQNEKDGIILLGVIHLLRALTKMKFGPDADAGSPPPVCRFDAYGTFMLKNIPVTVASFRHELPEGVDYIAVGRTNGIYGPNLLPTLSTINITLNPTYSRSEQMAAGVDNWLSGAYKGKGYL